MPDGSKTRGTDGVFVDSHVHIHPCFSCPDVFDAAMRNVRKWSPSLARTPPLVGVLMLAETAGQDLFGQLLAGQGSAVAHWRLEATDEACSIVVRRADDTLIVVAGRQIVTAERLEVLALATRNAIPDGSGLEITLDRVRAAGAVPVLPWGWGKWWFRRGSRVNELVRAAEPGDLYLGDNGGRARGVREPTLLSIARRQGIAVLAGSDPLPFAREVERVGSYGFLLDTGLDWTQPARSVVGKLRALRTQPPIVGRLRPPGEALLAQARLRLQ